MAAMWRHCLSVSICLLVSAALSFAEGDGVGEGIHCYQCHSKWDSDCRLLAWNSTDYYKPCHVNNTNSPPFCRKIVQRIHSRGGLEVVIRKCGWVRHSTTDCYRVRNMDHAETVCQCFSDGCNGDPLMSQPLSLLSLFCIIAVSPLTL